MADHATGVLLVKSSPFHGEFEAKQHRQVSVELRRRGVLSSKLSVNSESMDPPGSAVTSSDSRSYATGHCKQTRKSPARRPRAGMIPVPGSRPNRESGIGNRESGIGGFPDPDPRLNRESGIGKLKSTGFKFPVLFSGKPGPGISQFPIPE